MKRIINLLFAIVFALPLYSQEIATIDGIKYFLYNGEATIMEQDNPVSGSIVIPEIVSYNNNSYVVVSIADRAFSEKSITSIKLPNSIKSIGDECFQFCQILSSVSLPDNITSLGYRCFWHCFDGCTSLFSVTCPWENIDTVSVSGDAFRGIFSEAILNVPKGTEEMYKAVEPWKSFNRFAVYDKTGTGVGLSDILADEFGVELSNGGQTVAVSGLANGAKVSLYTTDGMLLSTDNASDSGTAMLDTKNEHGVLILKIGSKGHKIIVN